MACATPVDDTPAAAVTPVITPVSVSEQPDASEGAVGGTPATPQPGHLNDEQLQVYVDGQRPENTVKRTKQVKNKIK